MTMDALTDQEELSIQVLVAHAPTNDMWRLPIHAVDRALGLTTEESKRMVMDLFRRGHIVPRSEASDPKDHGDSTCKWCWKRGQVPEDCSVISQPNDIVVTRSGDDPKRDW